MRNNHFSFFSKNKHGRSDMECAIDILISLQQSPKGCLVSRLSAKTRIHYDNLRKTYLPYLSDKGLVSKSLVKKKTVYNLTNDGIEAIKQYDILLGTMKKISLPN
jgi:predicted transcriptional regulator